MNELTRRERLELILTYYILWKIKKEPCVIRKIIRHIHSPAKSFSAGDLAGASLADLGTKDHDLLDGLLDDDHTQYLLADGTRAMTGNLDMDSHDINNLNILYVENGIVPEINGVGVIGSITKYFSVVRSVSLVFSAALIGFGNVNVDAGIAGTGRNMIFRGDVGGAMTECAKINTTGEFSFARAGDISHLDAKSTIFDKASGNGIKVDTTAPTFGWRDLLGEIRTRGVGATDPNDAVYDGANIRAYQFAVNDEAWIDYHIPHDYVIGTDIHLHFHWSHNGTLVTGGNVTWGADVTYAKGHNQAAFPASVNPTVVGTASTTQYQHIITEVQISASAPAGTQIDSDDLEPDGVIMIRAYLSANNITVSGGAVPDPFLHYVDIHYQSTNIATKAKVPDFYT